MKPLNKLVPHLVVSSELSLKLSLTISAARACVNVSRAHNVATTITEKITRVLVLVVCDEKRGPRRPDVATSSERKRQLFLVRGLRRVTTGEKVGESQSTTTYTPLSRDCGNYVVTNSDSSFTLNSTLSQKAVIRLGRGQYHHAVAGGSMITMHF